ncbi:hypothetical protein NE237_028981 [Protea cynaroides]|uniref:Bidirectional sugar transporter SWEET n=1 Tax=Protea cynaroides TaxID=273540 RepID=A0A9Q0GUX9_9MAGN|nr:hypothetical protein NE237_028981 [Protea cynaroides]
MSCVLWVFYGQPFVHPDSILIVTINSVGLTLELIYLLIYICYAPNNKRMKVIVILLIEALFFVAIAVFSLECFHTHRKRSMVVGILCAFFGVCMSMSPLTVMGKVIRTKSVEYMSFLFSLFNFLKGIIWMIYALLCFDPYILIGSSFGAIGGLSQLILYGIYYKSTPKEEASKSYPKDEAPKSTEVQFCNSRSLFYSRSLPNNRSLFSNNRSFSNSISQVLPV